ncbi:MAG: peptidoglycan-binding protein, partial [Candidatus Magasanikiibacteriota bacterium]
NDSNSDDNDSNSDDEDENTTTEEESNEGEVLGIKITRSDELVRIHKQGERGTEIKELQDELKKLGFFPGNIGSTGYYGPITSAAVKSYLDNKNSEKTLVSLTIDDLIKQLKPGSRGLMVQKLQTMLKDLKYFPDMNTTLYYGPITGGAVKKYQAHKV